MQFLYHVYECLQGVPTVVSLARKILPPTPKTRHKHGANGSHGHVELGKENVNQISALVLNKPNYKIGLILIKTMSDYCYANK